MKNIIFNGGSIEEMMAEREASKVIAELKEKFDTENVDFWQCEPSFEAGVMLITPAQEEDFLEDQKGKGFIFHQEPYYVKNGNTAGLPYFAVEVKLNKVNKTCKCGKIKVFNKEENPRKPFSNKSQIFIIEENEYIDTEGNYYCPDCLIKAGGDRAANFGRFFWFSCQYPEVFREIVQIFPELKQYI